ncbi:MAG: ATP-grasp fold amidoligase family protein [Bacilli bacterium]
MKKCVNYILHPSRILLYLSNYGYFKWISDEIYLIIKYKLSMNRKLNLKNPLTFNEKLQWLKLYDRKKEYTTMVDKYLVRNYISKKLGEKYLIPLIGVYNNFDEINFETLPNQFVMKPNHTSGDIYICKNKNEIKIKKLRKLVNKWLKRNYYYIHREWPYKNVDKKIVIEQFMGDNLADYKFMCFNGVVQYLFVCTERNTQEGLHVTFFNKQFQKMSFIRKYPSTQKKIYKPTNYNQMIKFAELLSQNIKFVRVDFYEINNQLYFGELTFFPGSGYEKFSPENYDLILGDLLHLNESGDLN